MNEAMSLAGQIAMGISLAACAGLRAFLPLFLVGAAGRLGWIPLSGPFEWLSSWPALVVFGVAVVTEIVADKIPIVDHVLDMVQIFVKPAAGATLAAAVLTDLTPLQATVLGILAGGSTAGILHLAKAKVRVFSTAVTAGFGNPLLSMGEDMASLLGAVAALVIPLVMVLVVAFSLIAFFFALRRFRLRAAGFGR